MSSPKPKGELRGELDQTMIGYQWRINNFRNIIKKTGEYIHSPSFKITLEKKSFLGGLNIYPNGMKESCKDYLSLHFYHNAPFESAVLVEEMQVSLMCKNGILCHQKMVKVPLKKSRFFNFDKFIKREDLLNDIMGKDLLIKVEFFFSSTPGLQTPALTKKTNFSASPISNPKEDYKSKGYNDLEQLLNEEKYSDLKFIIGDKIILAHKNILVSRSQYFKNMLEHEMKESKEGVVKVTDIEYRVMLELLRFMYACKVNEIERIAWDLLVAANKYCMDDLKTLCENSIFGMLHVDNAVEYLVMTNSCNFLQLKTLIIQFIMDHPDIVERTDFKKLDADTMYEVTRAMARKRVKK